MNYQCKEKVKFYFQGLKFTQTATEKKVLMKSFSGH